MSKPRDIDIQLLIEARPERVFEAWLKPELLEQWLARRAVVEPRVGGSYQLFWEPEASQEPKRGKKKGARITNLVPGEELSFDWRGPLEHFETMGDTTAVFLRLEKRDGATLLRFTHTGWGNGPQWEDARAWQTEAWREALEGLKNMLENGERLLSGVNFN